MVNAGLDLEFFILLRRAIKFHWRREIEMSKGIMRYGLVCLALTAQSLRLCAVPPANQELAVPRPAFVVNAGALPASLATVEIETEPTDVDREFPATESRSQHAARVNRNLKIATGCTLTLFVLCRILLLWQISRRRKKQARENLLETKA